MGTPRASASLDQISNVQNSASRGGECAVKCGRVWNRTAPPVKLIKADDKHRGGTIVFVGGRESAFASGCDWGAVFFGDVAQQVLLAQQLG